MKCRQAREDIPLHSGGDLPPARVRRFEEHLEECQSCRRELARYRSAMEALGAPGRGRRVDLGGDYWAEIRSRLPRRRRQRTAQVAAFPYQALIAGIATVAAAILVVVSILLVGKNKEPRPDAAEQLAGKTRRPAGVAGSKGAFGEQIRARPDAPRQGSPPRPDETPEAGDLLAASHEDSSAGENLILSIAPVQDRKSEFAIEQSRPAGEPVAQADF